MSKTRAIYVTPRDNASQWAVEREGNQRATSLHDTQRQAIDAARTIARQDQSDLVINGVDGPIRSKDSHGHDPDPPRDKDR